MAAKYIFGNNQIKGVVSKLSGSSKHLAGSFMSDPQRMESVIGMVRTFAPFTSSQTVTKVNTYLPAFEKMSTLLGMYTFLNRAQTFRPIQPLNANSPSEAVTALMKNSSISKMLTQPLIANNMEKIMGTVAANMLKNGNLNDILASLSKNESSDQGENKGIDINGLMETFMPLLNSLQNPTVENDADICEPRLKNESTLSDGAENSNSYENAHEHKQPSKDEYDRFYKNDGYDNYDKAINYNENKNNFTEKKEMQKPIRIKQRRRR